MAARQAGFLVRHTEKIVLAAAAAFSLLLVVIAWSGIFGSPASTQVGNDTVTPGNVQEVVKAEAEKLRRALDASEPGVPDVLIPDYSGEFAARIASPLLAPDNRRLSAVIGNGGLPLQAFAQRATNHPAYLLPTPPLVTNTTVKVDNAVLANAGDIPDADEREMVADLTTQLGLPDGAPGDFQYVSVMARFPLAEWAERLGQPDPETSVEPIPANVWRPRLALGAVYLLRQQLNEQTGQWGEIERVTQLSNQVAYVPGEAIAEITSGGLDAEMIVSEIQARQEAVTRPAFPPTRYRPWTPPTGRDRIFSVEEQEQLETLEETIEDLEVRLERLLNPPEPRGGRDRPARRGPGGLVGGGGGAVGFDDVDDGADDSRFAGTGRGGPGGPTGPGSRRGRGGLDDGSEAQDPNQRRIQRAQDELLEARTQLNELLGLDAPVGDDFSSIGGGFDDFGDGGDFGSFDDAPVNDFAGGSAGFAGGSAGFGSGRTISGSGETIQEELVVWTHDLTAEAGATYRYKLVAAPINPLFRYSRVAEEQRQANRDRVTLPPSEADLAAASWTPAVTLNPEAEFFFLGGNADQDRARVEVWKVFDGLWQTAEFEENSGNAIGGERILEGRDGRRGRVDLSTGSLLLDVDVQQNIDLNPDQRLVYKTPSGQIQSRTRQQDASNERREKLRTEFEEQRAPVAAAF